MFTESDEFTCSILVGRRPSSNAIVFVTDNCDAINAIFLMEVSPSSSSSSSSSSWTPRRQKRHLDVGPMKNRKLEREKIQSRKKDVQDSILRFMDDSQDVDTFKQVLVNSARRHQVQSTHKSHAKQKNKPIFGPSIQKVPGSIPRQRVEAPNLVNCKASYSHTCLEGKIGNYPNVMMRRCSNPQLTLYSQDETRIGRQRNISNNEKSKTTGNQEFSVRQKLDMSCNEATREYGLREADEERQKSISTATHGRNDQSQMKNSPTQGPLDQETAQVKESKESAITPILHVHGKETDVDEIVFTGSNNLTKPMKSPPGKASFDNRVKQLRQRLSEASFHGDKISSLASPSNHKTYLSRHSRHSVSSTHQVRQTARDALVNISQISQKDPVGGPLLVIESRFPTKENKNDKVAKDLSDLENYNEADDMNIPIDADINSESEEEECLFHLILDIPTSPSQNVDREVVNKRTVPQPNMKQVLNLLAALDCPNTTTSSHLGQDPQITTQWTKNCSQSDQALFRDTVERDWFGSTLNDMEVECMAFKQALCEQFDLEGTDLDLILDHISAANGRGAPVSWDLVEALVFPDDQYQNDGSVIDWMERISYDQGNDTQSSEEERHSSPWTRVSSSTREHYQEVILHLIELEEKSVDRHPPEELFRRQQIMIQLLRATSVEKAHVSCVTLDDISEIVAHVKLSIDHNTQIQWSMMENVVFPLGIPIGGGECAEDIKAMDCLTANSFQENPGREAQEVAVPQGPEQDYINLSESDLEIVLDHIMLCTEVGNEIRWDLLAEILFPCDDIRQELLLKNTMFKKRVENNLSSGIECSNATVDIVQERARAVLSLSNHDLVVASTHDWDLTEFSDGDHFHEGSYSSFFEDSLTSIRRDHYP
jgi:hypothetical protein